MKKIIVLMESRWGDLKKRTFTIRKYMLHWSLYEIASHFTKQYNSQYKPIEYYIER